MPVIRLHLKHDVPSVNGLYPYRQPLVVIPLVPSNSSSLDNPCLAGDQVRLGSVWKVEKELDLVVPTDKQVVVNGSVDSIEDNIPDLDQILHQDTIAIVFCFDVHVFSLSLYDFLFLFTLLLFSCYMQKHLFVVGKRIDERRIREGNCTIEVFI